MQLHTRAVTVKVLLPRVGWSGHYPDCVERGPVGAGEGQKPAHW